MQKHVGGLFAASAALPPALVVSLRRSYERRANIAKQLSRAGVPFDFFDAVEASRLDESHRRIYNGRLRRILAGKDLFPAEIACLVSHKLAIEKMAAEHETFLIFEDDVVLDEAFSDILRSLLALPSHRRELVRFFGDGKHLLRRQRKIAPLADGFWLTRLSTMPGEAHAYLMTRRGAEKILRHLNYTYTPLDIMMGQPWKTGLPALTVYPRVAWQDKRQFPSNIGDERFVERTDVAGFERLLFSIGKPSQKLFHNVMKRSFYYGALPYDLTCRMLASCAPEFRRSRHSAA